jgi:hypothetical protein
MSAVRIILVVLICGSALILLWDGLIAQAVVAGIIAAALAIAALTLRPGETSFLFSVTWPMLVAAAVPALWILLQILPLGMLAHPIWKSAETALQHPIQGKVSIDPGASIIALGYYLSMTAVAFVSAAVAVDRQRAAWILFALSTAVSIIALIIITQDLFLSDTTLTAYTRVQGIDCAALGTIIVVATCIRTIERHRARNVQKRSVLILLQSLLPCGAALAVCGVVLILDAPLQVILVAGYGLLALGCQVIIRRFGLGIFTLAGALLTVLGIAIIVTAAHPAQRGLSVPLAFAAGAPPSLTAYSQRILDDAPIVGTGAGTFAALAPIYREIGEPPSGPMAQTTAATFAIELGKPMLWVITAVTVGFIITLLRASLQRGRDSFYSAMGGSCLITLLLLAFTNSGLLGSATGLIVAAALGLAFAQSKSRVAQI